MEQSPQVTLAQFFTAVQEDDVAQALEMLRSPQFPGHLSTARHPFSRLSPVHVAAFSGAHACLSAFLAMDTDCRFVNMLSEDSFTPAHYAAHQGHLRCLELLIEAGADLQAKTSDFVYKVSGFPIFFPGGRTPLHEAALEDQLSCFVLLAGLGDPLQCDNDDNSALGLALLHASDSILGWWEEAHKVQLKRPTKEQTEKINRRDQRLLRRRMDLDARVKKLGIGADAYEQQWKERRQNREGTCKLATKPISNPALQTEFQPRALAPSFREAVQGSSIPSILKEEAPGIFTFDFLTEEYCEALIKAVTEAEVLHSAFRQPNSMNRYGCVLDDVGFRPMLEEMIFTWVKPLCRLIFPDAGEVEDIYSFTVKYQLGQDVLLDTHKDSSDITINVCLGKQFEGGSLYFFGGKNSALKQYSPQVLSFIEERKVLELGHQVGRAVFHRGSHVHGANPITQGERWNLIVWIKTNKSS